MAEIQIETTQNVTINFRAADAGERILAYFIDSIIKTAYIGVVAFILFRLEKNGGKKIIPDIDNDFWSFFATIIIFGLPIIFYTIAQETLLQGQTLGKKLTKIKVVKIDGYRANFLDYFIRWTMRIVDFYSIIIPGVIALISIGTSKNQQRLGGMASGTAVISLKQKVSIDHTILQNVEEGYQPVYSSVIKLSDNDVRIIKENFLLAVKNNDFKTLGILREKITNVIGEEPHKDITTENFIKRVLKDYNHYTGMSNLVDRVF